MRSLRPATSMVGLGAQLVWCRVLGSERGGRYGRRFADKALAGKGKENGKLLATAARLGRGQRETVHDVKAGLSV